MQPSSSAGSNCCGRLHEHNPFSSPPPIVQPQGAGAARTAAEGGSGRPLLRALVGRHKWRLLGSLALQCVYVGIQFCGPLMLNQITTILSEPDKAAQVSAERGVGRRRDCRERLGG